jgi:hypothetical protein
MGDMTETLAAKSDQLNAIDIIGGPITVTVTRVKVTRSDQPVSIWTEELGEDRPYKPCLSMRRVLVKAWGADSSTYTGKRMTLFNDTSVKWAGEPVGGVRISHLSHIDKRLTMSLPETRGKQKQYRVEPLPDAPPTQQAAPKAPTAASIIGAFDSLGVTVEQLEAKVGSAHGQWTADDIAGLAALGKAIKAGETTSYEEFEPVAEGEQQTLGAEE